MIKNVRMYCFINQFVQIVPNVYVYELWSVFARTFPNKKWLWKIRRIFQVSTDQAIAYILCCQLAFFSIIFFSSASFCVPIRNFFPFRSSIANPLFLFLLYSVSYFFLSIYSSLS